MLSFRFKKVVKFRLKVLIKVGKLKIRIKA
ncbi:hypothetical protein T36_0424 [Helicobacter cinaedi]|nr:hypothetical protein T36_0424 [Helicobacter cinaedi]